MFLAKDTEELIAQLRKWESLNADAAKHADRQKAARFSEGRASAFRELANMLQSGELVLNFSTKSRKRRRSD